MPAQRRFGMDHEHYDWSPLSARGVLRWPENARMALSVVVTLEQMEWIPRKAAFRQPTLREALRPGNSPTMLAYPIVIMAIEWVSTEFWMYWNGMAYAPTIAMDALTARNYPYLVRHCLDRGCEIVGHGISVSRMITGNMSEQQEREYIRESLDALTHATGIAPVGWMGPEYESRNALPNSWARPEFAIYAIGPMTNSPIP